VLAKSAQQPDAEVHNEDDEERALNVQFQAYDLESIRERQQGIQQIERNVTELSDMFQDLQMLVAQQQESLDTIESNIQATKDETDRGLGELQEAEKLQRSARKRQCCILFIVLTILAVFVTIGVCASRHC
jgi:t-SNARE complex subunit (syntaxin)